MSLFSALRDGYHNRNQSRKAGRSQSPSRSSRTRANRLRAVSLVEMLEARELLTAIVLTDQSDYAPGSTAIITATTDGGLTGNFVPGETVHFHIARTDGVPVNAPPAVQDWYVTDGVGGFTPYQDANNNWIYPNTDGASDGHIGTSWYVDSQFAGASLELTASDQAGAVATTYFTDGIVTAATGGNAISADDFTDRCARRVKFPGASTRPVQRRNGPDGASVAAVRQREQVPGAVRPSPGTPGYSLAGRELPIIPEEA